MGNYNYDDIHRTLATKEINCPENYIKRALREFGYDEFPIMGLNEEGKNKLISTILNIQENEAKLVLREPRGFEKQEKMIKFYDAIEQLPVHDNKNFSFVSRKRSSPTEGHFHITTKDTNYKYEGMKGRFHLWDYTILPILEKYFGNTKLANRFYSSRIEIFDEDTNTELKIWSPEGDMVLSYFLGSRFKGEITRR